MLTKVTRPTPTQFLSYPSLLKNTIKSWPWNQHKSKFRIYHEAQSFVSPTPQHPTLHMATILRAKLSQCR